MAKARNGAENEAVAAFVTRWKKSGGAERANYTSFLTELCGVLDLEPPQPSANDPERDEYVFERGVTHHPDGTTSTGRIDLYKRNMFVLEAKQGIEAKSPALFDLLPPGADGPRKKSAAVRGTKRWSDLMLRARGQAEAYAKALPTAEGWPPFLIVCDVGHCFELVCGLLGDRKTLRPVSRCKRLPHPNRFAVRSSNPRPAAASVDRAALSRPGARHGEGYARSGRLSG